MSTQYDVTDPRPVSLQILDLVADLEGVEPVQLRPPLHSSVDPDALDDIVARAGNGDERPAHVEFSYLGYRISISVDDDPSLSVTENGTQDEAPETSRDAPELTETER